MGKYSITLINTPQQRPAPSTGSPQRSPSSGLCREEPVLLTSHYSSQPETWWVSAEHRAIVSQVNRDALDPGWKPPCPHVRDRCVLLLLWRRGAWRGGTRLLTGLHCCLGGVQTWYESGPAPLKSSPRGKGLSATHCLYLRDQAPACELQGHYPGHLHQGLFIFSPIGTYLRV